MRRCTLLITLTKMHLPQEDLTVDGFWMTIVRKRNAPHETKRVVIIRMSMACSVMLGLKKKTMATAAHSQTLNCAKAASCACHVAKLLSIC